MSAAIIAILFLAVVIISILVITVARAREEARIETARKYTALEDAHRRTVRILDDMPPQYLTRDLKLMLVERALELCGEMSGIRNDSSLNTIIEQHKARRVQLTAEATQSQPVPIDTPEKVGETKQLLDHLFKFIEGQAKRGKMQTATAQKYLHQILFLIRKTQADFLVMQASQEERQGQFRKAIHFYHLAIAEFLKVKSDPQAIAMVKAYNDRIKELETRASAATGNAPAEKTETKAIDKAWEQFSEEEEQWKKKADYDE